MVFHRRFTPSAAAEIRLVVGLGNIGSQYEHTRHNVGFDVVDELARRQNVRFRAGKFRGDEVSITLEGRRVLLLKPHTLMNLSGDAVVAAARFYKVPSSQILVVCDDVNLPVGKLRFRAKGSDGGHNGLWNIIQRLGTQDFSRLRIGVGAPPPGMPMPDYVLGRYLAAERPLIEGAVRNAADGVATWVTDGIEPAMNRWNAVSAG